MSIQKRVREILLEIAIGKHNTDDEIETKVAEIMELIREIVPEKKHLCRNCDLTDEEQSEISGFNEAVDTINRKLEER